MPIIMFYYIIFLCFNLTLIIKHISDSHIYDVIGVKMIFYTGPVIPVLLPSFDWFILKLLGVRRRGFQDAKTSKNKNKRKLGIKLAAASLIP